HPVKGIPVQSRKPGQMQRGFFVKRKRINAMLLSLCGDKSYGRLRKRQLTQRMFDDDLPGRDRAKVDLIPRIYEQLPCVIGEIRSISHRPQETAFRHETHRPVRMEEVRKTQTAIITLSARINAIGGIVRVNRRQTIFRHKVRDSPWVRMEERASRLRAPRFKDDHPTCGYCCAGLLLRATLPG